MKQADITKQHLAHVEFQCPVKGNVMNFRFDMVEAKVTIIDGKFASAQLGVNCGSCGDFHVSNKIETGFLVLRGESSNWSE